MKDFKIAVIGLGYVGLPLAIELGKKYLTLGYDIDSVRINSLQNYHDRNSQIDKDEFDASSLLKISGNLEKEDECNTYIITLPTPVGLDHKPDLSYLVSASTLVGKILKKGDLVIYESTVYPGATEEECIPILCQHSKLKLNDDFGVGYSPERINPGDKTRGLRQIIKVTSGSNTQWATITDNLYKSIIDAGTHPVSSIKIAEASKIIENTQRDTNIALVNQLSQLFSVLNIDTKEVLEAAGTKWNFLPFKPGLVGGHCISVDPYYLCHKAEAVGYIPDIILASRRLNDAMGGFVATEIIKLLASNQIAVHEAKILVLGITFKEDCPDIRNTKVVDIINELAKYNCKVEVHDPIADKEEVKSSLGINLANELPSQFFDLVILSVAHLEYITNWPIYRHSLTENGLVYDLKSVLPDHEINKRL
jgi:UDP-N-acetyl-D-galactosamine dehydrogenase